MCVWGRISQKGIEVGSSKAKVIVDVPPPKTLKELAAYKVTYNLLEGPFQTLS